MVVRYSELFMAELMHADIFFFITSLAVIVISLLLSVFLYYAIHIARDIRAVTVKIRHASGELEQDFESVRASVKREGVRIKSFFTFLADTVLRRKKRKD